MSKQSTVVTCYYKIDGKCPHENYQQWMKNMLTNIRTNMVIFCGKDMIDELRELRSEFSDTTVFIVKELEELPMYRLFSIWDYHNVLDPESHIHSVELYILWNNKLCFVNDAIKLNPFRTDWFVWMDIGAFRNRKGESGDISPNDIGDWPSDERIDMLPPDRMTFVKTDPDVDIAEFDTHSNGVTVEDLSDMPAHVGGLFVVNVESFVKIFREFYRLMTEYIKMNRFAGKDQNMMANMVVSRPDLVNLIHPNQGDAYFYLHHYLA